MHHVNPPPSLWILSVKFFLYVPSQNSHRLNSIKYLFYSKQYMCELWSGFRYSLCEWVCVCSCVSFHLLTVWGDCLNGLALASNVPYGQSPIWVTANELLALVMPGNWVDRLGNNRQEAKRGGGVCQWFSWMNIMCHHLSYDTSSSQCRSHKVHSTMFICDSGLHTLEQMVKVRWKKSGRLLQSISCGMDAYISRSFWAICWMWRKWGWIGLFF